LDRINEKIAGMGYRFSFVEMALAEINTIYEYLRDLARDSAPLTKRQRLGKERLIWQERLERALRHLEREAKQ
jgi:hypothetical protein